MTPFAITDTPLGGTCLIEAGAGTGKTYAIAGLYLRLILEGHATVDQILVVTFTVAATSELRGRIRNRLASAREAFRTGETDDPLERRFLSLHPDSRAAGDRIDAALAGFDRAAVYTIHGFCQRILDDHAFETRSPFELELQSDPTPMIQEAAEDFWRKEFAAGPEEWVAFARSKLGDPGAMARFYQRRRHPAMTVIGGGPSPEFHHALVAFRQAFHRLKSEWGADRSAVRDALMDSALKGNVYGTLSSTAKRGSREGKLEALMLEMDAFLSDRPWGFPLFDRFVLFSAGKMAASTKKGASPPSHRIFDICDRLWSDALQLEALFACRLSTLKKRFLEDIETALDAAKFRDQVVFFDDLLHRVRRLLYEDGGHHLRHAVRRRFMGALVDEFQDTDPVQYDIFKRLFGTSDRFLYMIGDPKQAIYSFRGADLFAYLKAVEQTDRRYTLLTNWRSTPGLIRAVNTVFQRAAQPFLLPTIVFRKAVPPPTATEAGACPSMILWHLRSGEDGKPLNRRQATDRICEAVASEINSLCSGLAGGVSGGRSQDIAVLTRTHDQAFRIREALIAYGIPAVLYDAGGVLQSREAFELEQLLRAAAEPGSDSLLRTALSTSLLAIGAEDLDTAVDPPKWWEGVVGRFADYHRLWGDRGFMAMFHRLMDTEGIPPRLLSRLDGERRLTNLYHIAELLHGQWIRRRPGMNGLLDWMEARRMDTQPPAEEQLMRLESDDAAVTVVTIHRSKGLEYPVVFCPFLWGGSRLAPQDPVVFHDPEMAFQAVMDLGSAEIDRSARLAEEELLAENLRLAYVALTRASSKCYVAWGRIKGAESSALAYLFHLSQIMGPEKRQSHPQNMSLLFGELDDQRIERELIDLAEASVGTIQLTPLPEPVADAPAEWGGATAKPLAAGKPTRILTSGWEMASFSSLLSRSAAPIDPELDRDAAGIDPEAASQKTMGLSMAEEGTHLGDIAGFPAGARAGHFFHDLFERIDYVDIDMETIERSVSRSLRRHGFDDSWKGPVARTVVDTLLTPLSHEDPSFRLSEIPKADRLNELAFYYPVRSLSPGALSSFYAGHPEVPAGRELGRRFESPGISIRGGFMKGFIDLVFRRSGRYFVADWKSNLLGVTVDAYRRSALEQIMGDAGYVLQYHLYTLAVNRWLSVHLPDYRYSRDFGGVYYLFFRGMSPGFGPESGVFFDRPSDGFIRGMEDLLMADAAQMAGRSTHG